MKCYMQMREFLFLMARCMSQCIFKRLIKTVEEHAVLHHLSQPGIHETADKITMAFPVKIVLGGIELIYRGTLATHITETVEDHIFIELEPGYFKVGHILHNEEVICRIIEDRIWCVFRHDTVTYTHTVILQLNPGHLHIQVRNPGPSQPLL